MIVYLNKVIAVILIIIRYFLFKMLLEKRVNGRNDVIIKKGATFGAYLLMVILSFGLFFTQKSFYEILIISVINE